ncbi:hypothetical protein G6F57_012159 [Rhizopus arrhizus]|uniref:Sugar phosphate transporter domain-containing protein n=1 Tax=Rhizopus oryzae TaxID=64495 RepID=A0A9P6X6F1_RHIOR|nr:hypothetical protein G6F23_009491 [Rhizopus arrhizus]KAG1398191.1 hypothetical protein G6F58_011375 [Rhizopus delemar]KAG0755481.1 hypothetical protein G6F24_011807 [Rhizopus arrhizus]KAG0778936.1 hypothetical protein G6F22_010934 [Rhizopus arrhizus]KAG0787178.1 hypothetical protein G6F21_008086 [Rhizopus arrhizus]
MTIDLENKEDGTPFLASRSHPPSTSNTRHKAHYRTQSITTHPVTPRNKTHSRRGSLPTIHLSTIDRSPFLTSPIEKAVSIHIANPKSDVKGQHVLTRHENTIKNLSFILLWYFFSTSLSLYNKNLMGRDRFNFNFPLLVSSIHAGLHFMITSMMMWFGGDRWNRSTRTMSSLDYLFKVVPCGIAAAVEICCSNASLVYITLSFYTMVKSSTPIWVLVFSFLFGFEKPRFWLIMIIVIMVTGVVLTVEGETKFDGVGFSLVLTASIISGLRWSMTQLLLQHEQLGIDNPIATLYYLSPVMFITMLTLSLTFESPFEQFQHSKHFDTLSHIIESLGLMSIGGLLAFAMTLAELYLIKNTNTVTLSVAGISKEIVIITLSVMIYGDVLTHKNLLGLFVSIIGIIAYNYYKLSKNQENNQYQMIPLHSNTNSTPSVLTGRNLED